jgi:hypothetical protein
MQIRSATCEYLSGAFALVNNGQTTFFDRAKLTSQGNMLIGFGNGLDSVLDEEIVKEATQLMIEHGIVITDENDKVGV